MAQLRKPEEAIVLIIGMQGTGEATLGREAANLLCCEFIELEKVPELVFLPLSQLFEKHKNEEFPETVSVNDSLVLFPTLQGWVL